MVIFLLHVAVTFFLKRLTLRLLTQVCIVATGVVGDLCRALEQDILPYCQHIMGWLMVNLEGASINR